MPSAFAQRHLGFPMYPTCRLAQAPVSQYREVFFFRYNIGFAELAERQDLRSSFRPTAPPSMDCNPACQWWPKMRKRRSRSLPDRENRDEPDARPMTIRRSPATGGMIPRAEPPDGPARIDQESYRCGFAGCSCRWKATDKIVRLILTSKDDRTGRP